ncbi:GlxA family transcriptional regulator [Pseudomonas sp. NCHU5208]|uniref:GlxA family transcriptional regulator n=1 Tax=unclassified Pseudomonas TaxID=196821 RepID=UPI003F9DDF97
MKHAEPQYLQLPDCDRLKTFGFLLIPNFTTIGFASAIEPLRIAGLAAGRPLYRSVLISSDNQPVAASNGVRVMTDSSPEQAPALDALFVVGANPIPEKYDRALLAWLRRLAEQGVPLGGICTGSHLLASAGLLEGYRCTLHWENIEQIKERFPRIIVSHQLYELDRDRYTCSGGTAALDMTLQLISREPDGAEIASRAAELLLCERVRNARDPQRIPLRQKIGNTQPKLSQIVAIMEANLEEPLELEELARLNEVSVRQLERLFHKYLARTPSQYYLELRLQRARELLLSSEAPVGEIALTCGFSSAAHFSKSYSRQFGLSPRRERQHSGMAVPARS